MSRLESRKKLAAVRSLVVNGYKEGSTLRELSEIYEVAPGTVRNLLLQQAVELRSRGRRRKNVDAQAAAPVEEKTDGDQL